MMHLDIILALDIDDETAELPPASFKVALPYPSSIGEFWPYSQQLVALPHDLQRTITTPTHATYIAFHLLHAIILSNLHSRQRVADSSASEHQRQWALDSCLTLWLNFKLWIGSSESGPLLHEIAAMSMQLLETFTLPNQETEVIFECSSRSAQSLSSSLVDLLQTCASSPFSEANQLRLASLLTRLRTVLGESSKQRLFSSRRHENLKSLVLDYLEPVVSGICQDMASFNRLHRDLQVGTARRPSQNLITDKHSSRYAYGLLLATGRPRLLNYGQCSAQISRKAFRTMGSAVSRSRS